VSPEELVVVASSASDVAAVAELNDMRARVDALIEAHKGLTLRLAARLSSAEVVSVADEHASPDSTEESFGVRLDARGTVVQAFQVPVSESGDWNNEFEYYFDETGYESLSASLEFLQRLSPRRARNLGSLFHLGRQASSQGLQAHGI
jgi:hypothetical protein